MLLEKNTIKENYLERKEKKKTNSQARYKSDSKKPVNINI